MANAVVHVVILCQGQQSRLPELTNKKQLLPVYRRGDGSPVTILGRTIAQVRSLMKSPRITVVGDNSFIDTCRNVAELCTLGDPGNSSLKGLQRFLKAEYDLPMASKEYPGAIVLLGDVIYTYDVLWELYQTTDLTFAVSSDLSPSGGELWGISWTGPGYNIVYPLIDLAMYKHPPPQVDGTYQPGQLRRVYWEAEHHLLPQMYRVRATSRDQYIMDIDKPDDLSNFLAIAPMVEADDLRAGVRP